jgi:hypothetical protein
MAQDLVGRVRRLVLTPKAEWDAIDQEAVEPQSLVTGYVAPLAAIPAVAGVIGTSLIGMNAFGYSYKAPLGSALVSGVLSFGFAIVGVVLLAFIINALAPSFGAQKNFNQALKVSAYAPTAGWLAGVFVIIPVLGVLSLIGGLYSLYLLFIGLPKLMKPPAEKATVYTVVTIIVAIIASLIFGAIAGAVTPRAMPGAMQMHAAAL